MLLLCMVWPRLGRRVGRRHGATSVSVSSRVQGMCAQVIWSLSVGGGGWREGIERTAAMRRIGHRGRAVAAIEGVRFLGMRWRRAWRGRIRCRARVRVVATVAAVVVVVAAVVVVVVVVVMIVVAAAVAAVVVGAWVWQSRVSRMHNSDPDFQVVRSAVGQVLWVLRVSVPSANLEIPAPVRD